MEEKNELNDIILSKGGSNTNSKKLLLAIAALTLILIIVLVIMNSLKTQSNEQPPVAVAPPAPTSPKEIVDDPLFEPVEVIQEGSGNTTAAVTPSAPEDLGKIAQKIKQESMQNTPVQERVVQTSPVSTVQPSTPKITQKPVVESPTVVKHVVNTPTIKTTKPAEIKKVIEPRKTISPAAETTQKTAEKPVEKASVESSTKPVTENNPKTAPKVADTTGTYYIQVGSFTKEPSKALFDRLNASGLKYTTVPNGAVTKVMVGPFQGKKAAQDVLGTVRKNVEANAFTVEK